MGKAILEPKRAASIHTLGDDLDQPAAPMDQPLYQTTGSTGATPMSHKQLGHRHLDQDVNFTQSYLRGRFGVVQWRDVSITLARVAMLQHETANSLRQILLY